MAIHVAKQKGELLLPAWEEELTRMVAEVSRKFFGALTTVTVRKGLDATIGILSLGLFHSTAGSIAPDSWVSKLREIGIKGVSKLGIDLVKQCDSLPESDFITGKVEGIGMTTRDLLLLCAKKGYPYLVSKIAERRANQRAIRLANWMLQHSAVGRIAQRSPDETIGDCAMADDVFFFVLARECAIPEEKLPENDDRVICLAPRLRKSAKDRYDAFVEKVPADLKSALFYNGESWFDRTIAPSSSNAKKTKAE